MDKQQKLKIILPVLVVMMAFVYGPIFFGSSTTEKNDQNTGNINPNSSTPTDSMDLTALSRLSIRQRVKTSYAEWDRNPFILGQKQDILMVEGILWEERNPKVMINGHILGVGEKVGNVTVVEINPNTIILEGKEGEVELGPGGSM